MNKLWLIIRREYLTRVTKKTFIIATLGTPVAILLFILVVGWIFNNNADNLKLAVKDDSGVGIHNDTTNLGDTKTIVFKAANDVSLDQLRETYEAEGYNGVLHVKPFGDNLNRELQITYYSDKQLGIASKETIERKVEKKVQRFKIEASPIDDVELENLINTDVSLTETPADKAKEQEQKDKGGKASSAEIASALGMFMGFLMYMVVFIYGSMVMRSVMEEKTNRIVEVMMSSVKPFQLMMGKIVGVGFVGLTQVTIWAILVPLVGFVGGLMMPVNPDALPETGATQADVEEMEFMFTQIYDSIASQNWYAILPLFILFFLGGYFLYSSLFAAVGSAIGDDLGEGQSLTIPIVIPVIMALYIMIAVIANPNSSMATWSSMIPLFSPIVMPARLAFNPPVWEIALSLIILLGSAIFFVWLSGRIYRVGILLYGKKANFKEIAKWLFRD